MKLPVVLLILCCIVGGYAVYAYGFLAPGTTVAPAMKRTYDAYTVRIATHVFSSVVALVLGPFQFMESIRAKRRLHRSIGYVYFCGVFVGGVSGLAMSLVAHGGFASRLGFAMGAIVWLFTAVQALRAASQRRFDGHQVWAIRCFAMTFGAVTLRLYLGLFFTSGLHFETFYPALAWISWVPNLLFAEWFLVSRVPQKLVPTKD